MLRKKNRHPSGIKSASFVPDPIFLLDHDQGRNNSILYRLGLRLKGESCKFDRRNGCSEPGNGSEWYICNVQLRGGRQFER